MMMNVKIVEYRYGKMTLDSITTHNLHALCAADIHNITYGLYGQRAYLKTAVAMITG